MEALKSTGLIQSGSHVLKSLIMNILPKCAKEEDQKVLCNRGQRGDESMNVVPLQLSVLILNDGKQLLLPITAKNTLRQLSEKFFKDGCNCIHREVVC